MVIRKKTKLHLEYTKSGGMHLIMHTPIPYRYYYGNNIAVDPMPIISIVWVNYAILFSLSMKPKIILTILFSSNTVLLLNSCIFCA